MFFPGSRTCSLVLLLALGQGCAGSQLEPTTASSASGAGYALDYVSQLERARQNFESDDKRARELTLAVRARASAIKPSVDDAIFLRVIEQSEQSGKSYSFARTRSDDRALRDYWNDERAAVGARVGSAAQKELLDAGCKEVDVQPVVQQALREGFDRQLERRTRAANEGQRTLEQNKARLAPASFGAMQRLSDETAMGAHLVHVSLVEDLRELDRLLGEQDQVDGTLARLVDEEREIQQNPKRPSEQKASQERVVQVERQRAALGPTAHKLAQERAALAQRQERTRSEYDNTVAAVKDSFRGPTASAPLDSR